MQNHIIVDFQKALDYWNMGKKTVLVRNRYMIPKEELISTLRKYFSLKPHEKIAYQEKLDMMYPEHEEDCHEKHDT